MPKPAAKTPTPTLAEHADDLISRLSAVEAEANQFIDQYVADNAVGGVPLGVQRQCMVDTNPYVRDGYSYTRALQLLRRLHIRG